MNRLNRLISTFAIAAVLMSCEDDIFPELEPAPPQVVIDAWINNMPQTQVIRVNQTLPYYDAVTPPGLSGATVYVVDITDSVRYDFAESSEAGFYHWDPSAATPSFGRIGNEYQLFVETTDNTYTASSAMNRVPDIDSVNFRFESNAFINDSYFAQFFARDIAGPGDTYWIKAYKNGVYLNKPNEINYAFDAGFSPGGNIDGVNFIQPIRDGINPFETDENDEFLSPYLPGDSVYVEIHSITYEAFEFLVQLQIQTDRPGGFAELFAVPLANVPTNIQQSNPDVIEALGFFNVSAVTNEGARLDPNNLPTEQN